MKSSVEHPAEPTSAPRPGASPFRPALLALAVIGVLGIAAWYFLWQRPEEQRRAAYLHAARGKEQADQGDLPGALHEYETATRLDPSNPSAWYLLGTAQRQQNASQGLPALERAARLGPLQEKIQRDYGAALLDGGKVDAARAALSSATRLDPTDVDARKELARAYLQRVSSPHDLDQAVSELQTVLRLQPGDVDARFRLGRALYQANRLDEARRELDQCLTLLAEGARSSADPMDGRTRSSAIWFTLVKGTHSFLGQIADRTGHPEEAKRHRELFNRMASYVEQTDRPFEALRRNPRDPQTLVQLDQVYARFGFPKGGPNGAIAARTWIPR